jgi:hypothetical protein
VQGFGPRFALEAGFLIALAIGLGLADLSATAIILAMAAAWLLVCLFELAVWAEATRATPAPRPEVVEEPDEVTPPETVEPAAITEIREADTEGGRRRFWRRRGAVSSKGA